MIKLLPAVTAVVVLAFVAPAAAVTAEPVPTLPPSFTWGVAGSAFQTEGGDLPSNQRTYARAGASNDPYGSSVDFRHRYRADIQLAKQMGITQFRFGIDWARVEPKEGVWDEKELAYYDDLVRAIVDAGMIPQPTLDHWDYPLWVYDQGAWNSSKTVDDFLAFVAKVVPRYKDLGARWLTFNEAFFYLVTEQTHRLTTDPVAMSRNVIAAHRRAYDLIHRLDPSAEVSSNVVWVSSAVLLKPLADAFLDATADKMDFIGFDYYYDSVGDAGLLNIVLTRPWETPQYPQGLYVALHDLGRRYPGKPIYVSENGMPTNNGAPRADGWTRSQALLDSVYWVQRAWADGVDVRGYQYWSLTDNYEFGSYAPRFGLYTVDVLKDPTLTRKPTDAVPAYAAITRRRGVPAGFRPEQIRCSDAGRELTCPSAADLPRARTADAPAAPRLRLTTRIEGRGLRATVRGVNASRALVTVWGRGGELLRRVVVLNAGRAVVTFRAPAKGRYRFRAATLGVSPSSTASSPRLRVRR